MSDTQWHRVCTVDQLETDLGEAALFGTEQIAVFKAWDGNVYTVSNIDPRTDQGVMSRGIVGDRMVDGARRPTISSPLYKEVYDLGTGVCHTSDHFGLAVYTNRVVDGVVQVDLASRTDARARALPRH
ncbi:nitrite reductase small subunit NirD [Kocuria sabuli]|uniref:nitrite reductase small subunit NirD n=1 Tax=Kocuria sabuli TaxID=3071448 RepID=UPI0034D680E0